MSEVKILHFTADENIAKILVQIAREKAYYTKTKIYNDVITFLFAAGIENYDICKDILDGRKTLIATRDEEHYIVFQPVDDNWEPPKPKVTGQQIIIYK